MASRAESRLFIRRFNGTERDARGIIEVDRETFGECEYTPAYILALQAEPGQHAWVAEEDGRIAGFVSAFPVHALAGDRFEIDELAVRPAYQGRGLGTGLVGAALAGGAAIRGPTEARALVRRSNAASRRAFVKNGFQAARHADLLIYEITGRAARPQAAGVPHAVARAIAGDATRIASLTEQPVSRVDRLLGQAQNTYLIAEHGSKALGCAELVHVRTLQYEGLWLESIAAPDVSVAKGLCGAAIEVAKRLPSVELVGYALSPEDELRRAACVSEGLRVVGEYSVYAHPLVGIA